MGTTNLTKFIPPNAFYPPNRQSLPPPKSPSIWYYISVIAQAITKLLYRNVLKITQSFIEALGGKEASYTTAVTGYLCY